MQNLQPRFHTDEKLLSCKICNQDFIQLKSYTHANFAFLFHHRFLGNGSSMLILRMVSVLSVFRHPYSKRIYQGVTSVKHVTKVLSKKANMKENIASIHEAVT